MKARQLNAPGKFLVSAPEHDIPRRARAYLFIDQTVIRTAAYFGPQRPQLDHVSRNALDAATCQPTVEPGYSYDDAPEGSASEATNPLRTPSRTRTPRRAFQVSRGRWRAGLADHDPMDSL